MKKSLKHSILLGPLIILQKLMGVLGCPWMIIGGVAVGLLSKPRFTADIDAVILVNLEDLPQIIEKAEKLGLKPRVKDPIGFARKNRVLLFQHQESGVGIDISLGLLPFEKEAIQKSKRYKVGNVTLNLPTIEDLIIFKAVAHRPQDLLDIQEIINLHPKINKKYLKKHLSGFAQILDMPEIWADVESKLKKAK
jgi:hypothetical protein